VEFPSGEARALKVGARFGNEDVEIFALFDRDAKDAEGGADACGCERSGVALSHDAAFARHEFGAEAAHGFVGGFFLEVNLLRFSDHRGTNFFEVGSLGGDCGELFLHPVDGPEKIDGGGARFCQDGADLVEFRLQFGDGFRVAMKHADRDTHCGGNAYRRRAANHHVGDCGGDFAVVRIGVVNFLGGKQALVEHDHAFISPFNGLGDIHRSREEYCSEG
jgi:hypothetical protein